MAQGTYSSFYYSFSGKRLRNLSKFLFGVVFQSNALVIYESQFLEYFMVSEDIQRTTNTVCYSINYKTKMRHLKTKQCVYSNTRID